jgi:hypothetical protein
MYNKFIQKNVKIRKGEIQMRKGITQYIQELLGQEVQLTKQTTQEAITATVDMWWDEDEGECCAPAEIVEIVEELHRYIYA